MNKNDFKDVETDGIDNNTAVATEESSEKKKGFPRTKNRFEFALFLNEVLICKRSFPIDGYVEKSMYTPEFKSEVDKMVELIDEDLKSKSRVYTWYHLNTEHPEWEPEIMIDPLIEAGTSMLKLVIYDNGKEVISKAWDARYYPNYVRKSIDLTNHQVKIMKGETTNIYDKDEFFADYGNELYGNLYVLKHMISDKDSLVPVIQKMIYEVCSSFDGFYEKISDYNTIEEYKNDVVKRDSDGNPMYTQRFTLDANGEKVPLYDALGEPLMALVLEKSKEPGKRYYFNIDAYNKKIDSKWGAAVAEKTRKYMEELYVTPKDKRSKKSK